MREETIGDCRLILGDCMEVLPTLGKVDAVVTDPPFGIGNFVQPNRGVRVDWNDKPPEKSVFQAIRDISLNRIIWGANYFNCFERNGGAIVWDKCQAMPNMSKCEIASCSHNKKIEYVRIPWTNYVNTKCSNHPCERPVSLYRWCIEYLPNPKSVLDAYMGSGSVGVACAKLGRKFIGIEISEEYFDAACRRIEDAYKQGDMFVPAPEKIKQENLL